MSIVKSHSVFCDGCADWIAQVTDSQDGTPGARREAKAAGWVYRARMDLCPVVGDNPRFVPISDLLTHPSAERLES